VFLFGLPHSEARQRQGLAHINRHPVLVSVPGLPGSRILQRFLLDVFIVVLPCCRLQHLALAHPVGATKRRAEEDHAHNRVDYMRLFSVPVVRLIQHLSTRLLGACILQGQQKLPPSTTKLPKL
jgi:hypothetical protein